MGSGLAQLLGRDHLGGLMKTEGKIGPLGARKTDLAGSPGGPLEKGMGLRRNPLCC